MLNKSVSSPLVCFLMLLLCSCASFQDQELARPEQWVSVSGPKPTVLVSISCRAGDPKAVLSEGRCSRLGQYQRAEDLQPLFDKLLAESGYFSAYRFAPNILDADYTLELRLTNHFHDSNYHPLDMMANFANRISLGLIPAFDSDRYVLEARVLSRSKQSLASVSNTDSTTNWSGIWLLPVTSYPPSKSEYRAFEGTVSNQLRVALDDLVNRGALSKPAR